MEIVVPKTFLFGFSTWKHPFIKPFLKEVHTFHFINPLFSQSYLKKAVHQGLNSESVIYIWGKKPFDEVERYANEHGILIYRVEDGFLRSVGLGSDLTQPYSLVVDSRGIYFDPSCESDLEYLLNHHEFTEVELDRAEKLCAQIISKKLSKYNNYDNVLLDLPKAQKIVLVPGQVEDDASIRLGANSMTNLELLKRARQNAPDAYVIYKPHPDVLAGNRVGHIREEEALRYCDRVVTEVSLDSVLTLCDEVHTLTSLVGFEAIIRGIKVYTYGLPFYAGWGLSEDAMVCTRRQRTLSVNALSAATLLLYPRYLDPKTLDICEVEEILAGLEEERFKMGASWAHRNKIKIRNFVSRKGQLLLRLLK